MSGDEAIVDRLRALAAARFGAAAKDLSADADMFEVLGIDSLQALDLLTDLEEEFRVEIPDYELQGVKTFEALAVVIDERK